MADFPGLATLYSDEEDVKKGRLHDIPRITVALILQLLYQPCHHRKKFSMEPQW